jgi:apolipoprotein N-acyltransferase
LGASGVHQPVRGRTRAALLCGALLGVTGAPFAWAWLAPLPLAAVFALIAATVTPRAALRVGYASGVGFFAVHLIWLPFSFVALFGAPGALTALLPFVLAGFWALLAGATRALAGRYTLAALPFAWVILEWLRAQGPLAFPWGFMGYALLETPLIQSADLGGVYLVSLLVTALAAGFAYAPRDPRPLGVVAVVWLLALGYGLTRPAASPDAPGALEVVLVQGAVNPLRRAGGTQGDELELHLGLTRQALTRGPAALVVWPESSVPVAPTDPAVASRIAALGTPAIIGAPTVEGAARFNSAYAFQAQVSGRFDKTQLVPFGEFFPLRDALAPVYDPIFSSLGLPGLRGVTAGRTLEPLALGTVRAAAYICYESAFPGVARALVARGANLLVNISNDAWFGRGFGADQHFALGRVRAIETRRFLVRAGNDGVTAVVNPSGAIVARLPRFAPGTLRARVQPLETLTPYVRFGDWVVWASAGALLVCIWRASRPRPLL